MKKPLSKNAVVALMLASFACGFFSHPANASETTNKHRIIKAETERQMSLGITTKSKAVVEREIRREINKAPKGTYTDSYTKEKLKEIKE